MISSLNVMAVQIGHTTRSIIFVCGVLHVLLVASMPDRVHAQDVMQHAESPSNTEGQVLRHGPKDGQGRLRAGKGSRDAVIQPPVVQALDHLSVILGRPTDRSITANVMSAAPVQVRIDYGLSEDALTQQTPVMQMAAGIPIEVLLSGLKPSCRYYYRLLTRSADHDSFIPGSIFAFSTQKGVGQSFAFELQGDSHPERAHQFDARLYAKTLLAAAADQPDFYITMGDDFSVDTLHEITSETVSQRYRLQRPFLAIVGQTAPVFMVNGNHEQAAAANLDGGPDNVAVWAQNARHRYYPLPAPDHFYRGDSSQVPHIGLLRDYYAWTWGDALFVVIDPYWHSPVAVDNRLGSREKGGRDLWDNSLGDEQYRWLSDTLMHSKARYKFVFAHHVLGTGRGGIEMARQFEWGGHNKKGSDEFASHRPNWPMPIHQLMVKAGVTIFFQGHDHVFAHQQLDGITYQTAPQPADPNYTLNFQNAYQSGDVLPNSGRLRVTVDPKQVRVEYLRSWADDDSSRHANEPAFAYDVTVPPHP